MGRYRIELVTMKDCQEFVNSVSSCNSDAFLEDNNGFRVNAKSLLGALASTEWDSLYCISEKDVYEKVKKWII